MTTEKKTGWLVTITFRVHAPTAEAALLKARELVRDPAAPIESIVMNEVVLYDELNAE